MRQKNEQALIEKQAKRLVGALLEATAPKPHRCEFRGSNMPFCSVDMALTTVAEWHDFLPSVKGSYTSDLYLGMGTVAHSVTQRWLGRQGVLWGDWRCPYCQHLYCWSNDPTCPKCGRETIYRELAFAVGDFTGHCDGFIELPTLKALLLLEIKTTSVGKLRELPYAEYVAQVTTYREAVRQQHDIDTAGVLFLFLPRDKFYAMRPVVYLDGDLPEDLLGRYQTQYDRVFAAVKRGKIGRLKKRCRNQNEGVDRRCPWNVMCFSKAIDLDEFVREKCRDAAK
jgi:hypothetical protein